MSDEMDTGRGTGSIRAMRSQWSLAGDRALLKLLDSIHQNIILKSQQANTQMEDMMSTLDSASVSLQNVNNRFMALSNSQFIESRVYDDDVDAVVENKDKKKETAEVQTLSAEAELELTARGLHTLEQFCEELTIGRDSDSDTDSEDDVTTESLVLRARDLYSERPLPHVIGSEPWKAKWHVGLLKEESDSDTSVDKSEKQDRLQYSSSDESETDKPVKGNMTLPLPARQDSFTSEEMPSEDGLHHPEAPQRTELPEPKLTPSDFAAELARRLGGQPPPVLPEPDVRQTERPKPVPPQKDIFSDRLPPSRLTGQIFFDEPPPLDNTKEDDLIEADPYEEDDDDIFAQIHNKPPTKPKRITQEESYSGLFDNVVPEFEQNRNKRNESPKDIFDDFADNNSNVIQKPGSNDRKKVVDDDLFTDNRRFQRDSEVAVQKVADVGSFLDEADDDLFNNKQYDLPKAHETDVTQNKQSKVLAGAKSPFGSAQGADNISAEILKRHRRKNSSSSEDDTPDQVNRSSRKPITKNAGKGKYESNLKVPSTKVSTGNINKRQSNVAGSSETKTKVADLFKDDLFDDIDDLFTSSVQVKSSINRKNDIVKDLFDDVDDLFSNVNMNDSDSKDTLSHKTETHTVKSLPGSVTTDLKSSSLFDDDDDDMDNIFANAVTEVSTNLNVASQKINQSTTKVEDIADDLFSQTEKEFVSDKGETTTDKDKLHTVREVPNNKFLKNGDNETVTQIGNAMPPVSKHTDNALLSVSKVSSDIFHSPKSSIDDKTDSQNIKKETIVKPVLDIETITESNILSRNINEKKEEKSSLGNVSQGTASKPIIPEYPVQDQKINKPEHTNSMEMPADTGTTNDTISCVANTDDEIVYEKGPISASQNVSLPTPSDDIFDDIFSDKPPDFTRSTSPKKSKNVNALFDDDSDDEGLFFKRNENSSPNNSDFEDSNESSVKNSDRLFGLFHNEPPKLNVGVPENADDGLFDFDFMNSKKHDDISASIEQTGVLSEEYVNKEQIISINDQASFKPPTSNIPVIPDIFDKTDINAHGLVDPELNSLLKEPKEVDATDSLPYNQNSDFSKHVGKLKHLNLNINVNSLLPGASRQKFPKSDQSVSVNSSGKMSEEESNQTETDSLNRDTRFTSLVKSISFEQDPESAVLSNVYSKERARIQVKRRPSSRSARKEAIRKSAIHLKIDRDYVANDDTTDSFTSSLPSSPQHSNAFDASLRDSIPDSKSQIKNDIESVHDSVSAGQPYLKSQPGTHETLSIINTLGKVYSYQEENKDRTGNDKSNNLDEELTYHLKRTVLDKDDLNQEPGKSNTITDKKEIPSAVDQHLSSVNNLNSVEKDDSSAKLLESDTYSSLFGTNQQDDDIFASISSAKEIGKDQTQIEVLSKSANLKHDVLISKTSKGDIINELSGTSDVQNPNIDDLAKLQESDKKKKIFGTNDKNKALFSTSETDIDSAGIINDLSVKHSLFETNQSDNFDELFSSNIRSSILVAKQKDENNKLPISNAKTSLPLSTEANYENKSSVSVLKNRSIFDDGSSDEDLFGTKKTVPNQSLRETRIDAVNTSTVAKVFSDSDSDQDLFSSRKNKKTQAKKENSLFFTKKSKTSTNSANKKKSLFGDDSDDEIFSVKDTATKAVDRPKVSKEEQSQVVSSAEHVFKDPLSLLED